MYTNNGLILKFETVLIKPVQSVPNENGHSSIASRMPDMITLCSEQLLMLMPQPGNTRYEKCSASL